MNYILTLGSVLAEIIMYFLMVISFSYTWKYRKNVRTALLSFFVGFAFLAIGVSVGETNQRYNTLLDQVKELQ